MYKVFQQSLPLNVSRYQDLNNVFCHSWIYFFKKYHLNYVLKAYYFPFIVLEKYVIEITEMNRSLWPWTSDSGNSLIWKPHQTGLNNRICQCPCWKVQSIGRLQAQINQASIPFFWNSFGNSLLACLTTFSQGLRRVTALLTSLRELWLYGTHPQSLEWR